MNGDLLKRSTNVQGNEGYIRYPNLGLSFRWNGYHGVGIFTYRPGKERGRGSGKEIDYMTIGDFSKDRATTEDFKRAVESYMDHVIREEGVDAWIRRQSQ